MCAYQCLCVLLRIFRQCLLIRLDLSSIEYICYIFGTGRPIHVVNSGRSRVIGSSVWSAYTGAYGTPDAPQMFLRPPGLLGSLLLVADVGIWGHDRNWVVVGYHGLLLGGTTLYN